MTNLPKPKHCGQDWLDMKPVAGGRLCGQCDKVIIDFSKMRWADIERVQRQNGDPVCGMYSPKQLDHWGREVPANGCTKMLTTAALFASLTASAQQASQATATNDTLVQRTVVRGTVTGKFKEGVEVLPYANIYLKNTMIGTVSDVHGRYQLDLTHYADGTGDPTVVFSAAGYEPVEIVGLKGEESTVNVEMNAASLEPIYFHVAKPTLARRIGWTFKKWFGRKDK